ncbi:hypothetical protein PXK00_15625 [Phaeobacter sp. QD34_3]|uniref:hypothetical protein n=1 Tax=unclassified Phaeobacter TaxID=2621772 RepID=UPI00237F19DA|nr:MULTISPECIES: hypothetical protein [unclassified Phaeobacter]MDE4134548.1 hypothetical protein [Phaeobacter sp. QD34_3]MDE4138207.1 hypothetical protein [Phaeobacter sp. QD34_24]MDE4174296.1 hypothetical protein [Phaeobacter sp. PT47_59]
MATLIGLCEQGLLDTIDPLSPHELPWRSLYGTPDFIDWLDRALPTLDHNDLYDDLTPQDQVFVAFHEYVAGEEFLEDRRFKKLSWTPERFVWEIKTEEVRVFGWVPHKNAFICCYGDSKDRIETERSYGRYIAQTVYVRDNMDLDEPKLVRSGALHDVVSNKD